MSDVPDSRVGAPDVVDELRAMHRTLENIEQVLVTINATLQAEFNKPAQSGAVIEYGTVLNTRLRRILRDDWKVREWSALVDVPFAKVEMTPQLGAGVARDLVMYLERHKVKPSWYAWLCRRADRSPLKEML